MVSIRHRQSGYLMVEILLVLALIGLLVPQLFQLVEYRRARTQAEEIGHYTSQITTGVRRFLSEQGPDALTVLGCTAGALCERTGTNWLKDADSCAAATQVGVTEPFVPCGFPDTFGQRQPKTYLFPGDGTPPTDDTFRAVTLMGVFRGINRPTQIRFDLAQRAAARANAARPATGGETAAGTFFRHYVWNTNMPPAPPTWPYDPITEAPEPAQGELVGEVTTAAGLDIYLRTDGANEMNADLDMGGHSIVEVLGLERGCITGTISEDADGDGLVDAGPYSGRPCGQVPVNVGDLFIQSIGQTAAEGVYSVTRVRHNDVVPKPVCPAPLVPKIFTPILQAQMAELSGNNYDIQAFTAYALDCDIAPTSGSTPAYDSVEDGSECTTPQANVWQIKIRGVRAGADPESLDVTESSVDYSAFAAAIVKCGE